MVALAILSPVFFSVRTTHRRQDRRRYAKDTVDSTFMSPVKFGRIGHPSDPQHVRREPHVHVTAGVDDEIIL